MGTNIQDADKAIVITLTASDDDVEGTDNTKIRFSLLSGHDDRFLIDAVSGKITTAGAPFTLDREAKARYELEVQVMDHGVPALSSVTFVTVIIEDFNDVRPYFTAPLLMTQIREDATVNTGVGRLLAEDNDLGAAAELRYAIVAGNIGAVFAIDTETGLVSVAQGLDRENVRMTEARQAFLAAS